MLSDEKKMYRIEFGDYLIFEPSDADGVGEEDKWVFARALPGAREVHAGGYDTAEDALIGMLLWVRVNAYADLAAAVASAEARDVGG